MVRIDNERVFSILSGLFGIESKGILYISIPSKYKFFVVYSVSSGKSDEIIEVKNINVEIKNRKVILETTTNDNYSLTVEF